MASIAIVDLRPAGSELFLDGESFMGDLSDELAGEVSGGFTFITPASPASAQIGAAAVAVFVGSVAASYNIFKK
jgi:hypothetical protein